VYFLLVPLPTDFDTLMDPWNVCITRHLWSSCRVILLPTIQR